MQACDKKICPAMVVSCGETKDSVNTVSYNKTEIQMSRKFYPDPSSIGCMSSPGVHAAHVHPGPQSQTHWGTMTGEATVGAGAGTSGIAVVPLPSMLVSSTGPAAMAHCKTEQEDWLLAHLKYLLFIFNFFFWVSGGCGTPLPTPALWPRSLWSLCTKVGFSQVRNRAGVRPALLSE